jgi:hypothetical protein
VPLGSRSDFRLVGGGVSKLYQKGKRYLSIAMAGLMAIVALLPLSVDSHANSPTIPDVDSVEAPSNLDASVVISDSDFQTTPAPMVRLGDNALDLLGEPSAEILTATFRWAWRRECMACLWRMPMVALRR